MENGNIKKEYKGHAKCSFCEELLLVLAVKALFIVDGAKVIPVETSL
jgi:hypothetical protein